MRPASEERAARVGLLGENTLEDLARLGQLAGVLELHTLRETLLVFRDLGGIERLLGIGGRRGRLIG